MKKLTAFFVALMVLPTFAMAEPTGFWSRSNAAGETKIEIEPCNNQQYCGTIVWMENPRNDTENPDPNLRDRPLVGVQIFNDMAQVNANKWEGSLYNPEDGNTYSGSLTQVCPDTLELEGCAFIIFCQSDTWTRTTFP